ncbi:MAG TPA: hypothetical protein EYP73_02675 [Acidimicrobiia bacterium]|nr:hypothetical protein [Acidimicrobiia bacterium]
MSVPDLETSGLPLVFRVENPPGELPGGGVPSMPGTTLRTVVRALGGMQKEAVVTIEPNGSVWRLASDEGPYLNGTDLAPFPLAFFAAGMQFCLLSEVLQAARFRGVELDALSIELDNRYSMEGSFLRGDALGGALPPEISVSVESVASPDDIARIVAEATARCPAQALMREVLTNTFALSVNRRAMDLDRLPRPPGPPPTYDESLFDALQPTVVPSEPLIEKLAAAEAIVGVEGGAGSSLQAEQKRTLHVHSEGRWVGGMRTECDVQLLKPIGSTFRFQCDETGINGGEEQAPQPLAYLTAGIGFCFMTQLGRYAHIIKRPLGGYAIVQDNSFGSSDESGGWTSAGPTQTHVFVKGDPGAEIGTDLVTMGERTCFLHAAMRSEVPSLVNTRLNGETLTPS